MSARLLTPTSAAPAPLRLPELVRVCRDRSAELATALPAAGLCALVALPLFAILSVALTGDALWWSHLAHTLLADYVTTTLALCVGVGLATLAVGTGSAWLVAMHRFPGRGVLEWALVLPLAMPAYVLAYAYTDFLQFT